MRLIDADALIEVMKKTEEEYENAMTCPSWWSAYKVIKEQPTAYDAEQVVGEAKEASRYVAYGNRDSDIGMTHRVVPFDTLEKIVRKGGVK